MNEFEKEFFDEAFEMFAERLKQRIIRNGKMNLKAALSFLNDLGKCFLIEDEFQRKIAILKCYEKHSKPDD
jgi:hypothetical protein